VSELHGRLEDVLALSSPDRERLRRTVREVAEERWSWAGIARRLLAVAVPGR
jgi:hypothetical protein